MPPAFDPSDPEVYAELLRESRWIAIAHRVDPSEGQAALHEVLKRVSEGKLKPLESRGLFRVCVIYELRSSLRKQRRAVSLEGALSRAGEEEARDARLLALGLVSAAPPDVEIEEAARETRSSFARGLARLGENYRRAVLARIRGRLERQGGREKVEEFERSSGVALGPYAGTAALAVALGEKPMTVASWAHRGTKRLSQLMGRGGTR